LILLVGGATRTVERFPEVGCLVQPRAWASMDRLAESGRWWAADNDCFQRLDVEAYWSMITRISRVDRSRFLWVACPDVVADAQATVNRWLEWFPQLEHLGLPAAFVGQDGIEAIPDQMPWDQMTALFVGGSTAWKLSEHAESLMREAKRRGKLVHIGRVNTKRRVKDVLMMCQAADSMDGKSFSAWPDEKIPLALRWIRQAKSQPSLF
jgi:hypothetical protein